jgi:ABC-type transport system substrate-binding protein
MIDALRIRAATAADVPAIANIVDQAYRHYIARIGTLPLRQGITWHDGKPFTAKDVQCTWDLLTGKASEKLRVNPRKSWYRNLAAVTTNGDY